MDASHVGAYGAFNNRVPVTASHSASWGKITNASRQDVINNFKCPANFVPVPTPSSSTDPSFCVAKYEMKKANANANPPAESKAAGAPYTNVDRDTAITKCTSLGSGHDLINNAQWQFLARNIYNVADNWSSETVGSGQLNQGHSTAPLPMPLPLPPMTLLLVPTLAQCRLRYSQQR